MYVIQRNHKISLCELNHTKIANLIPSKVFNFGHGVRSLIRFKKRVNDQKEKGTEQINSFMEKEKYVFRDSKTLLQSLLRIEG
jgi:hypothetical protein